MPVRVEGLSRLERKLAGLSKAQLKGIKVEVMRTALNIQAAAKLRAPVDTGRLRNSIDHDMEDDGLAAVVGTNVEYAPYVEHGTRHMRPRPFLFPAAEGARADHVRRIAAALDRAHRDTARSSR